MKRTHKGGVFDWFREPENTNMVEEKSAETSRVQADVLAEIQEDGARVNVIRAERLSRMERGRKEWEGKMILWRKQPRKDRLKPG